MIEKRVILPLVVVLEQEGLWCEICPISVCVVVTEKGIVVSVLGPVEQESYGESFQGDQMERLLVGSVMEKDH